MQESNFALLETFKIYLHYLLHDSDKPRDYPLFVNSKPVSGQFRHFIPFRWPTIMEHPNSINVLVLHKSIRISIMIQFFVVPTCYAFFISSLLFFFF